MLLLQMCTDKCYDDCREDFSTSWRREECFEDCNDWFDDEYFD